MYEIRSKETAVLYARLFPFGMVFWYTVCQIFFTAVSFHSFSVRLHLKQLI